MVTIGGRRIGEGAPCFVVAEAGVNHDGSLDVARALVDAAAAAGADAVKFQAFHAEGVASAGAPKAAYQKTTTPDGEGQLEMLQRLELTEAAFAELKLRAERQGLVFLATPFDDRSVDLLDRLDVAAFKVASPDIANPLLLREIGRRRRPVLLSTGTADLREVETAVAELRAAGSPEIVVLQCTTSYPAPADNVNLLAMATLAERLGLPIGFSDHSEGLEIAFAAVALGAAVLEKHFTLDRGASGPDHRASLEPTELADLVTGVRRVEAALGDGVKRPTELERENAAIVRRSLAAAADLPAGTLVEAAMLTTLRPGTGIAPSRIDDVVGRTLLRDFRRGELLRQADLA